jgi:sialate O-acetylesterase
MKKGYLFFLFIFSCYGCAFADIRLPKIFGDSMVLQRDRPVAVWGWADANEKIIVSFHQQTKATKADSNGHWKLMLDAEKAGGPYILKVTGKNTITLRNILMGEVWVCSGQSNMEMAVKWCDSAENEIKEADFPMIRQVALQRDMSGTPQEDIRYPAAWKTATPGNVADFSAVGYFFARDIYRKLKVPVGIIHSSWGGTNIETWTSADGFRHSNDFKSLGSLPRLDVDSFIHAKKESVEKLIRDVQRALPDAATIRLWKEPTYNDETWSKMKLPAAWKTQQLKNFYGIVWFRKTISINASDAGKAATLSIGIANNSDETYVNGVFAGKTANQNKTTHTYKLPAGILKSGKNTVALKVEGDWGDGGLKGNKEDMRLEITNGGAYDLSGNWLFQVESISDNIFAVSPNVYPSLLFNAMINPLLPYTIRGVLWYQGESNADRAYEYRKTFPLMIKDWRRSWNQGVFPFYFVQLSSFNWDNGNNSNTGSKWAELREAQAMALNLPNTGMAVTYDIGNAINIHPHNKQDVGKRLAAVALQNTYDQRVVWAGPTFELMKAEGNKITIEFSQTYTGLKVKDKYGYVKGFEIAGGDHKFYFAKATIVGHRVVVSSDSVANPVAVRYAWADDAREANLYNKEGFPASPFRTDQWKGITEDQKYKPGL